MTQRLAVLLAVAAAAAVVAGSARADAGSTPKLSPNWSGYVAHSKKIRYTSVAGTWTVPRASCTLLKGGTASTVWIGLGGYTTGRQAEVGTGANCLGGRKKYYGWFELVPYHASPVDIEDAIHPGDVMSAVVRIEKPKVLLRLVDRTQGWTFQRRINWAVPDTSSAEWIMSAPATCIYYVCKQASLTNFGAVRMRGISAVGDSVTGTLTHPGWDVTGIRLVPSKLKVPTFYENQSQPRYGRAASPAGSTPSHPSKDGRSFQLTWVPVATKGL